MQFFVLFPQIMFSSTRPAGFISAKSRVLSGSLSFADRPLTSQGLTGMPVSAPCKQREGKTYYLGLLQQKNQEITAEINKLENQIKKFSTDGANFRLIVEENKTLEHNIQDLKGQIADYQLLATGPQQQKDASILYNNYKLLKDKNDKETERNNNIFMKRAEVEESIKKLQRKNDIVKETVESMCPAKQREYFAMTTANEELLKKMDVLQEEMDLLLKRKAGYELELAHNNEKREMLALCKELTAKQEELRALRKTKNPQGEEHFIKMMEKDSKELASIEKQLADLRSKEKKVAERIHQSQDSRVECEKLKKREEKLDRLLTSVERSKAEEQEKFSHTQDSIASFPRLVNNHIKNCSIDSEMAYKLKKVMSLLVSGSAKAVQPEGAARAPETELLRHDLKRVYKWKGKIRSDLSSLKELIGDVEAELTTHPTRRRSANQSEKKLQEECERLTERQRHFRQALEELDLGYNDLRKELMKTEEKGKTLHIFSQLSKLKKIVGPVTAERE